MLDRSRKLAIYMEGAVRGYGGKMGFGVLRYSPNPVVCVVDSETAGHDMADVSGIPRSCPIVASVDKAVALGAQVLVLGIAPTGGLIPESWLPVIDHAIDMGLSIVNGLHDLLGPRYPSLPNDPTAARFVWDIRIEPKGLQPATGKSAGLSCQRVLLIGTDMNVGKMTAGLEIMRVAKEQGIATEFVATGQIGITITGAGVPLDAIRVDFASGSIEQQVVGASDRGAELVIVEGQGALCHPGSTANLPLLRGTCPTDLILCHRAGQEALTLLPEIKIPPLGEYVRLYEDLATVSGTFPRPGTVGVALNTFHVKHDEEALEACASIERELGIPCVDPIRHGPDRLVTALHPANRRL
jgi:uncharacterized NAD-dependent epimerase/dehydratase family protein